MEAHLNAPSPPALVELEAGAEEWKRVEHSLQEWKKSILPKM